MSNDVVENFEINGMTVEIVQDEGGDGFGNPRDADNVGVMVAPGHRSYTLGDEPFKASIPEYARAAQALEDFDKASEFVEWAKTELGATVVLPLWLLDHSGLSMRTTSFGEDPGNWDSGIVGFIFDTTRTREMTGVEPEHVEQALTNEVQQYDLYLRGEVYGYRVLDPDGNELDSCWGFLGLDEHLRDEAKQSAASQDAPKFVAISGGITSGVGAVYGPYDTREEAALDRPDDAVLLLTPPPLGPYRVTAGESVATEQYPVGTTITIELTRGKLAEMLAKGWILDN